MTSDKDPLWEGNKDLPGAVERLVDLVDEIVGGMVAIERIEAGTSAAFMILVSHLAKQGLIDEATLDRMQEAMKRGGSDGGN